jgi:large subunit ribosomal protein L18
LSLAIQAKGVNTLLRKPSKNIGRQKRQLRARKNIIGSVERPRLNVFRSLKHIYAQIINDKTGTTLVAASTLDKELQVEYGGNTDAAKAVGEAIAKRALEKGITKVVFDRAGYIYHGRVAALAAAAREAGLEF